ncbi:MAG: acylphosphatase, partial [bacterium]
MKHLNIKISGKVQGVFYRVATKNKARDLDLTGFVRNEPDDSVYIEVEGEEENLNQFIDFCKSGSDHAEV